MTETEQVVHDDAPTCWCKPDVYEECVECEPFFELPEAVVQERVVQAVAVLRPSHGVQAKRPKKSKDCWRCGGDGLYLVEAEDAESGRRHVFHNDIAPEE